MTEIGLSLDWLRFTIDFGWQEQAKGRPSFIGGQTRETRGILSYNAGVKNEYHSVYWHTEHPEFRVLVEITGKQLSALRQAGYSQVDILSDAVSMGANFTRIDYAVDLFDTGGKPEDVLECWRCDQVMTVAKALSQVTKENRKGLTGATVYVGSRQSERLIRVYDKGKQAKTKLDWIRVELEAKGRRAVQLSEIMMREGIDSAGKAMIRDVVEWSDIGWFESIWKEDYTPIEIDAIGRPETDRERWLREVVVPVIADELESGAEWLRAALEAILHQTDKPGGHGPLLPRPKK